MSIDSTKITGQEVQTNHVEGQPDILGNDPVSNKRIFDNLPKLIVNKHNELVEFVKSNINQITPIQTAITTINQQITNIKAKTDNMGVYIISETVVDGFTVTKYSNNTMKARKELTLSIYYKSMWGSTNLFTSDFYNISLSNLNFSTIKYCKPYCSGTGTTQAFIGQYTCTPSQFQYKVTGGYASSSFTRSTVITLEIEGTWQ